MVVPSVPLIIPLRGDTALFGVPAAEGPVLQCLNEAATQLAGISVLQDAQGQYISGLQLSWYDVNGATIQGPVLETSPGTPPLIGRKSMTVPLGSRMLQVEATFSRNNTFDTLFLEAIQLTWLTRNGSAGYATVCCDAHLTKILTRETHRHILDPCDIISGCRSYPHGESHFRNLQLSLGRTPYAVRYSSFQQIGGPTLCTWNKRQDDQFTIRAPKPPKLNDDIVSSSLSTGYAQQVRIFDDMVLPYYVSMYVAEPSEFTFAVANLETGDVEPVTVRVTASGLRAEELSEQVSVKMPFNARTDGVNDWFIQMTSFAISDAVVKGTCTATLYWVDFNGNQTTSQVQANVTLDKIIARVGQTVTQAVRDF